MLAAVNLDNQIGFAASEVREIGADRQLANKLVAIQSPPPQFMPQPFLRIVFDLPQLTGFRNLWLISATHGAAPHPPFGHLLP